MRYWRVEVFCSIPVTPEPDVPIEFGGLTVTLGDNGEHSDPGVNLVYDPVGLRIEQGEAWMYTADPETQQSRNGCAAWRSEQMGRWSPLCGA